MVRFHSTHKGITASDYCPALKGGVVKWGECRVTRCIVYQCLKYQKIVIVICSFNYFIALETKCRLCKASNFIVHFMTCVLKHINTTMQVFTRTNEPICSSIIMGLHSLLKVYLYIKWKYHKKTSEIQLVCRYVCQGCM